ncbi:MAG: multinuclear nonheme iron-dependent oxidase [Candidatus Rokuibacteriota bacterium]
MAISVGAFYNPHLAATTLDAQGLIEHLAMADPPRPDDPHFPAIRERFVLLLHDFLGQLSEPLSDAALARARHLAALYNSPWAAEHLQRVHTTDGGAFVDYVFPPLYTEDLLADYITHARALREALALPLVLEPIPTYLALPVSQLGEVEFVHRFYAESGCGMLLDIAHAWLSAHYAGVPPREFVAALPLERIVELHVAGVEPDRDLEGPWIGAAVPDAEILALALFAAERAPALRAVTFDAFSSALTAETLRAGVRVIREAFGLPA